jgi:L-fucose mutarotase
MANIASGGYNARMLKGQLIQPQILAALARAGHGSKVLISDGNYPHWTKRGPSAEVVYLNLAPGIPTVTQVLEALLATIPVEAVQIMDTLKSGPYAMPTDPPIWAELAALVHRAGLDLPLSKLERHAFYEAAGTPDVCLTIATGEQRIYANVLLTIGVVK